MDVHEAGAVDKWWIKRGLRREEREKRREEGRRKEEGGRRKEEREKRKENSKKRERGDQEMKMKMNGFTGWLDVLQ